MLNAIAVGVRDLPGLGRAVGCVGAHRRGAQRICTDGDGTFGPVAGYGTLFAAGLSVGLLGLVGYDRYLQRRRYSSGRGGPGAMSVEERPAATHGIAAWSPARQMALLIAVGIGLHNFAEGLAIWPVGGEWSGRPWPPFSSSDSRCTTPPRGFGIVAPLAGDVDANGVRRQLRAGCSSA